ncbi:hypothetical protein [Phenylobacterium deserti]|nr:hypothetical protein [Phenylobacterium deserti]
MTYQVFQAEPMTGLAARAAGCASVKATMMMIITRTGRRRTS